MSFFNKKKVLQDGTKLNYKYLIATGILFIITNAVVTWLNPDLITKSGIYKLIDRNIKFYLSEMEIDLNLDNASAIHNIKVIAVSENLDLEMCNDANVLEFQIYDFNYDSTLHSANDAEIISSYNLESILRQN